MFPQHMNECAKTIYNLYDFTNDFSQLDRTFMISEHICFSIPIHRSGETKKNLEYSILLPKCGQLPTALLRNKKL